MPVNVANIRATQALIRSHPSQFNMGFFSYTPNGKGKNNLLHNCNTLGCIAGWAAAAAGQPLAHEEGEVQQVAAEFLGLDIDDASGLFYRDDVYAAYQATPEQGIAVLEHLALTGEVNWKAVL